MAHHHRTNEYNVSKMFVWIVYLSNHTLIFRRLHWVLQYVRPMGLT